jgi:hypothetical protein
MFVIKAGPRAELRSKELVINIVRFLQDSSCDIIWGFSNTGNIARPTSLSELLQGLIYQALSKQPGLLDHSLDELNITKFQQDHTEDEWIRRPINPRKRKAEEWHHLRSKIWRDVGQSNPRSS